MTSPNPGPTFEIALAAPETAVKKSSPVKDSINAIIKNINKKILDQYIKDNNIEIVSNLMVAQYNSPWALPPFRKNELIYKIK